MPKFSYRDYQLEGAKENLALLFENKFTYLAWEERTGKTGTILRMCDTLHEMGKVNKVLVLTKVKAKDGWLEQIEDFGADKNCTFVVSTYHSCHKVVDDYDLVILDESHNYISGVPKPSAIWKKVKKLTAGKPIIYASATPHAQGFFQLYHQFALSSWSPWKDFRNYYRWYEEYAKRDAAGNTVKTWIQGVPRETYKDVDVERLEKEVAKYFSSKTRKELGFKHEPQDRVHYVQLGAGAVKACQKLSKDKLISFTVDGKRFVYNADTTSKLRTALHQLEGGTIIVTAEELRGDQVMEIEREGLILNERSKIDYIKDTFGDTNEMVVMYNFKAEKEKLEEEFDNALILQATSFAEGVDLAHKKHLIIYSQDYSVARHTQRRARQASMSRTSEIIVHHILVKKGISEQVYDVVCVNKKNFVDSRFKNSLIKYI